MDSVRIWRSVAGDMNSCPEINHHYTIRGLESYTTSLLHDNDEHGRTVLVGGKELSRQRDAYTRTVLHEQDSARIRPLVEPWTRVALERAQMWAAQDALDAAAAQSDDDSDNGESLQPPLAHPRQYHQIARRASLLALGLAPDLSNDHNSVEVSLSPPCSPNSVVLLDMHSEMVTRKGGDASPPFTPNRHDHQGVMDIKKMNQRLIQQMQEQHRGDPMTSSSSSRKKQRRSTLSHLPESFCAHDDDGQHHVAEQRRQLIIAQRRNSMQLARLQQEQLQLEHEQQRRRQLRRRHSVDYHHGQQPHQHPTLLSHADYMTAAASAARPRASSDGHYHHRHRDSLALGYAQHHQQQQQPVTSVARSTVLDALQEEYLQTLSNGCAAAAHQQRPPDLVLRGHGRRDSLLAHRGAAAASTTTAHYSPRGVSAASMPRRHSADFSGAAAMGPYHHHSVGGTTPSPQQQQHHRQQPQQQPTAWLPGQANYADSVTSLSRLRRDSLVGGHF
jgi:hypothetical protein